mmetsp:Transcript_16598/g.31085  ORF Transcript_16598/g.31085 Transcript_16598/m.31085 type:complete len:179 (+) Transcript_16598:2049-2585(+)
MLSLCVGISTGVGRRFSFENTGNSGRFRKKRFHTFRRLSQSLHSFSCNSGSNWSLGKEMLEVDKWAREEGYVAADVAMDILLRHQALASLCPEEIVDNWAMAFVGLDSEEKLQGPPQTGDAMVAHALGEDWCETAQELQQMLEDDDHSFSEKDNAVLLGEMQVLIAGQPKTILHLKKK